MADEEDVTKGARRGIGWSSAIAPLGVGQIPSTIGYNQAKRKALREATKDALLEEILYG